MSTVELICTCAEETESIGEIFGRLLPAGARIDCIGELGAGKTTFARGVLRGLGHPDPRELCSPTFALHHRYEGGRLVFNHMDLYRVSSSAALVHQGVLEPLDEPESLALVEWPETLPDEMAPPAVRVHLGHTPDQRRLLHLELGAGVPNGVFAELEAYAHKRI